ncbi:unnamed protein product, partial [Closterium sp. Yama58-4]
MGEQTSELSTMSSLCTSYFSQLYSGEQAISRNTSFWDHVFPSSIPASCSLRLGNPFSLAEIEHALNRLAKGKTPGLDGLPGDVFRSHRKTFTPLFHKLCVGISQAGLAPTSMLSGRTVLIPKKGGTDQVENLRPITLMNADYKVIAHVLASRLQIVLPRIINPAQSAFIKGRRIGDTINDTLDLMDWALSQQESLLVLTVDIRKAYDMVDRDFLYACLQHLGLPEGFIRWVRILHSDTTTRVSVNNLDGPVFPVRTGVRQGCPLAPLLFVCVIEVMQRYLSVSLPGFAFCNAQKRLMGCYADDVSIFLNSDEELSSAITALHTFASVSATLLPLSLVSNSHARSIPQPDIYSVPANVVPKLRAVPNLPGIDAEISNPTGWRAEDDTFDEPTEADAGFESTKPPAINDKPLIGILSQPGDGDGGKAPRVNSNHAADTPYDEGPYGGPEVGRHRAVDTNVSYIAASYAKWVESAGARPVPLLYDEPVEILRQKFDMINGLLIPGGGTDLVPGPFMSTVQMLLKWAKEANDRNDYFPVQATCMGFEAMAIVISEDPNLLELRRFSALDLASPLKFVGNWVHRRSYFSWMSPDLAEKVQELPLTMENHQDGTTVHRFLSNSKLRDFFFVLTTSFDKNGLEYVTTVQGKRYPFYGTQWHPEKNAYEWGLDHIPHGAHAIAVGQAAANFFVNEVRRNTHRPASDEGMNDMLLYNHAPVFAGKNG